MDEGCLATFSLHPGTQVAQVSLDLSDLVIRRSPEVFQSMRDLTPDSTAEGQEDESAQPASTCGDYPVDGPARYRSLDFGSASATKPIRSSLAVKQRSTAPLQRREVDCGAPVSMPSEEPSEAPRGTGLPDDPGEVRAPDQVQPRKAPVSNVHVDRPALTVICDGEGEVARVVLPERQEDDRLVNSIPDTGEAPTLSVSAPGVA